MNIRNLKKRIDGLTAGAGIWLFAAMVLVCFWRLYRIRYWVEYTDENDSFSMGWLLTQGYSLYDGIFHHHTHLSNMVAHIAAVISPSDDIWHFRAAVWFCHLLAALSIAISPLFDGKRIQAWFGAALYLYMICFNTPIIFGHMLLTDILWGDFFVVFLACFFLPMILAKKIGPWQAWAGGAAVPLWVSGSLITIFPLAVALLASGLAWYQDRHRPLRRESWRCFWQGLIHSLVLNLLWIAWFADFKGMIDYVITFNTQVFSKYLGEGGAVQMILRAAGDYADWIRNGYRMHVLYLAAVAALIPLVAFSRARDSGSGSTSWRWSLGFLAALLILSLRLRGGHWRELPFYTGIYALLAWLIPAYLTRFRIWSLIILSILFYRFGIETVRRGHLDWQGDDFANRRNAMAPVFDYIRSHTDERDPILVLPVDSINYIQVRRPPAHRGIFYYPWQVEWEFSFRPEAGNICLQLEQSRPKFILLEPGFSVWNIPWSGYRPDCIDVLIRENYQKLDIAGPKEVWRRQTP